MNIDALKTILTEYKLIKQDKFDSFICICPICGDHPDPCKQGHLYISKDVNKPIYHCFFCGAASTIRSLIIDITSSISLANSVITKSEMLKSLNQTTIVKTTNKKIKYIIPELDPHKYEQKNNYLINRFKCKNIFEFVIGDNIIYDINKFIELNHIKLYNTEIDIFKQLHDTFIGFLCHNRSMLIFRNTDTSSTFRYYKKIIHESCMMDYISFYGNDRSCDHIVLAEGVFDTLNVICKDAITSKFGNVKLYASGQSFSYTSLLRSICYSESLYKVNITILSDTDKMPYHYNKFIKDNSHVIRSLKIYHNKRCGDFGENPVIPVLIYKT